MQKLNWMALPLQIGIVFDDRVNFQYPIKNLCKEGSLKLSAMSHVALLVDLSQKKFYLIPFSSHSLASSL